MLGGDEVALVDDDDLRFLDLLAVDVADIRRKAAAGGTGNAEDPQRPEGIDDDTHRRDREAIAIDPRQWQADRGDQIGAAPHRLGEENVGGGVLRESIGGLDERIEPAAEAAAGDLLDGEGVGADEGRVDEPTGLIIGD